MGARGCQVVICEGKGAVSSERWGGVSSSSTSAVCTILKLRERRWGGLRVLAALPGPQVQGSGPTLGGLQTLGNLSFRGSRCPLLPSTSIVLVCKTSQLYK